MALITIVTARLIMWSFGLLFLSVSLICTPCYLVSGFWVLHCLPPIQYFVFSLWLWEGCFYSAERINPKFGSEPKMDSDLSNHSPTSPLPHSNSYVTPSSIGPTHTSAMALQVNYFIFQICMSDREAAFKIHI